MNCSIVPPVSIGAGGTTTGWRVIFFFFNVVIAKELVPQTHDYNESSESTKIASLGPGNGGNHDGNTSSDFF
jgi:hypothetical protein